MIHESEISAVIYRLVFPQHEAKASPKTQDKWIFESYKSLIEGINAMCVDLMFRSHSKLASMEEKKQLLIVFKLYMDIPICASSATIICKSQCLQGITCLYPYPPPQVKADMSGYLQLWKKCRFFRKIQLELIWKTEKDVLNNQKDLFQSITNYLMSNHVWSDN